MRTNEITREQISALADGELAGQQIDIAFASLRQPGARADWEIYHQIGDVLRSDEMAVTLSPGFAARMAARLDAESPIVAPAVAAAGESVAERSTRQSAKRWAIPSAVAAVGMAALSFIATPQLMVALTGDAPRDTAGSMSAVASSAGEQGAVVVASSPAGDVILRDSRIDDYLLAHQRFSPSVYSAAQYARTATFSSDTGK